MRVLETKLKTLWLVSELEGRMLGTNLSFIHVMVNYRKGEVTWAWWWWEWISTTRRWRWWWRRWRRRRWLDRWILLLWFSCFSRYAEGSRKWRALPGQSEKMRGKHSIEPTYIWLTFHVPFFFFLCYVFLICYLTVRIRIFEASLNNFAVRVVEFINEMLLKQAL